MEKSAYSRIYRIIHWAIAITFLLLLVTIFLRSTWMNKNSMASIIDTFLSGVDVKLSQQQLVVLAKQIREPMWIWHLYFGYMLVGLFTIRFSLPLIGEMKFQNPLTKSLTVKERFKKWTYIIFYLCVVISLITGLFIEFGAPSLRHAMEEVHVLSLYYLIPFIVIHFAGIFLAESTDQKGIVSRMISGKK